MLRIMVVCVVLCTVGTGCATARIQAPTLLPTNAYPYVMNAQHMQVAADPYFTERQASQVFGQDLVDLELLPVWTVIDNQGKAPISLPREQAYLVSPGGKIYPAITPEATLPKLDQKRQEGMGAAAASMGLIGALTFLAMTSALTSGEPKTLEQLVKDTAWAEKEIASGERGAGFLYFDLPGSPSSLDGYAMRLEVGSEEGAPQKVEILLQGER